MTAKRKATRKKATTRKPRANYGANEHPRQCRNVACKSTNSRVKEGGTKVFQHPHRTVRYRECVDCGQNWSSLEVH